MLGLTDKKTARSQTRDGRTLQNWRSHSLVTLISLPDPSGGACHSAMKGYMRDTSPEQAYVGAILDQKLFSRPSEDPSRGRAPIVSARFSAMLSGCRLVPLTRLGYPDN